MPVFVPNKRLVQHPKTQLVSDLDEIGSLEAEFSAGFSEYYIWQPSEGLHKEYLRPRCRYETTHSEYLHIVEILYSLSGHESCGRSSRYVFHGIGREFELFLGSISFNFYRWL